MTRPKTIMPDSHFKNLVNQCVELGANTVSIFGYGEPLLDPGIRYKVAHCFDLGLDTFITTNASTLKTDLSFSLLKAGLSKIRFSVHGIGDAYERVHRGLKWETTIRNISNFIVMNRIRFDGACKTAVSIIPMNDEKTDDLLALWKDNVDEIEIWKPHGWAGGRKYRKLSRKRKLTCGRPSKGPIQILADGKMVVCCFDFNGVMEVGNTHEKSIEEILKGERYNYYRDNHRIGTHEGTLCADCDQRNIGDTPLLYSNVDESLTTGLTSSTKFSLECQED